MWTKNGNNPLLDVNAIATGPFIKHQRSIDIGLRILENTCLANKSTNYKLS